MSTVTPRVDGGRPDNGRFANGNSFGRGNPPLRRYHAIRTQWLECTTDEDVAAGVAKTPRAGRRG